MRRTVCACNDDLRSTRVGNYRKERTQVEKKKTVLDFMRMKENGEKFSYLVLYDFIFAMLGEQSRLAEWIAANN